VVRVIIGVIVVFYLGLFMIWVLVGCAIILVVNLVLSVRLF